MLILSKVKSLNDLPENLRDMFKLSDEGELSLDETRVKTEADVANMKKAKDKEVADHNAAKAELAKFREIAKTPDELTQKIQDLESRGGNSQEVNERLAEAVREKNQLKSQLTKIEGEFNQVKPEYENLRAESRRRKTEDALNEFVKNLKGVDGDRLRRSLNKDIQLGLIELDESGEGLKCKTGDKLEDYAMTTAKDFGFLVENTPGVSSPGSNRIPPQVKHQATLDVHGGDSVLDDDVVAKLKL